MDLSGDREINDLQMTDLTNLSTKCDQMYVIQ